MKHVIKNKAKLVYKFGFLTSSLLNIGAMESSNNQANNNNIKTFSDTKNVKEQEDNNNQSNANIENKNSIFIEKDTCKFSNLISHVDNIKEQFIKGNCSYSSLNFLDKLRSDRISLNKHTNSYSEINHILSLVKEIFESRQLLTRQNIREIRKLSKENNLDKFIYNEDSYLNSEIFNGKFFYNFDDNLYNKIEIAIIFKVFGNIFRKFNSIKNIFTAVFKRDLYFIICDRNANDKSLYKLISRKLKKYEKKPEDFKGFDKNCIKFDHNIDNEENPFTVWYDVFLVISLYPRDTNTLHDLYKFLPDCMDEYRKSVLRIIDLFSHNLIDDELLNIYSHAWDISHEFFHSLDRCVTSLLYNSKFSYIKNNELFSQDSVFKYICESIICKSINCNDINLELAKFFKEKISDNDKYLEEDFTNYLTNIIFLDNFKNDQYLKKNYHTIYMFNNFEELHFRFSLYNGFIFEYINIKNDIFYLYFFKQFCDFSIFNDDNLKKKLVESYKEITEIGKTLPGIEIKEDKVKILKVLRYKLVDYYFNFVINCRDFNCMNEINKLYKSLFSKTNCELFDDLRDKSNPLSNFGFHELLYLIVDKVSECIKDIKKLKPELNITEFLAESFALSLLPDIFHAGPTSVVFFYFKYIEYVYNSYSEFCKQNDKDKSLFDEIIDNLKKNN